MSTLRAARKRKGLTPTELGSAVGVSARTIHHFEQLDAVPKLATAIRLAEVLGLPIEQLVPDETEADEGGG